MPTDYNILAKDYDLTRTVNLNIINLFAEHIPLDGKTILDFGCGTGNYIDAIKKITTADIYGVDPSDGMREKALAKGLDVRKGDHSAVPFDDDFFDFIYMTDVIHHVPDIKMMFSTFARILKPGGLTCVLTESHRQLKTRFWVKYFPSTIAVEMKRYPDIPVIVNAAKSAGLCEYNITTTGTGDDGGNNGYYDNDNNENNDNNVGNYINIAEDFVKLVEDKGYSMFRLIDESDYETGLAALKTDYINRAPIRDNHSETLIWLKKAKK